MLCVSHFLGEGWAVTESPETPPNALASHWPRRAGAEAAGEAKRIPFAGRGAARVAAHPPRLGSPSKFVNSGGGGRAPLRTSERRGGARAGGRRDHSPEPAKRPEAQSSAPQSAASRRTPGMLGDSERVAQAPTVQTAGLALPFLDQNKSGSAAPPTGLVLRPGRLEADSGAGLRRLERRGCPRGPRLPPPASRLPAQPPAQPHPASCLGPVSDQAPILNRLGREEGLRSSLVWFCPFILDLRKDIKPYSYYEECKLKVQ